MGAEGETKRKPILCWVISAKRHTHITAIHMTEVLGCFGAGKAHAWLEVSCSIPKQFSPLLGKCRVDIDT